MSADERESQLSAMFDGELPDSECELLARRLSRDAALKQQWARYSLIGAVIRDEPVRARRDSGGRVAAGIAARLAVAIEAEQGPEIAPDAVAAPGQGPAGLAPAAATAAGGRQRWARPAAGFAIAAGVAALSVVWLQGRSPVATPVLSADAAAARAAVPVGEVVMPGRADEIVAPGRGDEVIAPPAATRGAGAEVVVAGNGYPAAGERGPGSGEPESYVVPMPAGRAPGGPPAQLANYVVAHSEFSAPLSRRSLLSALVASETAAAPQPETPALEVPEAGAGK
jgi:negative regulator of sigma E activity